MKKKTFIVQLLDSKKPSRTSFTQVEDALFYSNDTDAHLVFLPHEQEGFEFNEATVALYNTNDESLVERPAVIETFEGRKSVVLKMTEDILAHWGRWQAQVVFKQGDKINTSVVVRFDTLRYMLDQRPPTLRDVIKLDELYSQLVTVMDEIAGKDVISAPEIILARGGENTLGERLDKEHNEVTTQLAQTMTTTEFDSWVATLLDGGPSIFMNSLAMLESTYPDGAAGVALVRETDPAKIYVWNGLAWEDFGDYQGAEVKDGSITNPKIADKSVTPNKTNFLIRKGIGKNLYNPNDPDIVSGMMLNPDGTMSSHSSFEITGYIPVKAGDVIHASRSGGSTSPMFRTWVLYNPSKVIITGDAQASNAPVSITHDGYLRVSHNPNDTHFQLEVGSQATDYEPYSETYAIDTAKVEMPEIETEKITRKTSLTKNLYNPDEVIFDKLLNEDGTLVNNGTYGVTGKIPVEEYQYISVSRGEGSSSSPLIRTYVWFDGDDNLISGNQNGAISPIQAPQGARWLQITHNPIDVNYQVEVSSAPTSYEPFVPGEQLDNTTVKDPTPKYLTPLHGKKLVANGDSIMAGQFPADPTGYETRKYMFIQQVADTFGMDLVNQAIGGSTVAVSTTSPNERTPLVERYQSMPDGDLVIISIGTNDWANNWTELGDMSNRSNNTFYGALHNLCLGLIEKYDVNRTQLVFMTPIKRSYGTVLATPTSTNEMGKTLGEYAQIIMEVGSYYGIPVIDMYNECSLNPSIESQKIAYVPDGTHPNTEGHDVMARRVIGFIKQLV